MTKTNNSFMLYLNFKIGFKKRDSNENFNVLGENSLKKMTNNK